MSQRSIWLAAGVCFLAAGLARADELVVDTAIGDTGLNGVVRALHVTDVFRPRQLVVGGGFTACAGQLAPGIARWDGRAWHPVGSTPSSQHIADLVTFDTGDGPSLFAGRFWQGESFGMVQWGDEQWTVVQGSPGAWIQSFHTYDAGQGPELYVSGAFAVFLPDGVAEYIIRWDGQQWRTVGQPGSVAHQFLGWDDGSGEALYAVGSLAFLTGDGQFCSGAGYWDGEDWKGLGEPCVRGSGEALAVYDDGSGEAMYLAGLLRIGSFPAHRLLRWDGQTATPVDFPSAGTIYALVVFDDGSGPALYVGGEFELPGDQAAVNLARWDGENWSPVTSGTNGPVLALEVLDEAAGGPALVVAGEFSSIDGKNASSIALLRPRKLGDLNDDHTVDVSDLLALLGAWGQCADACPADLDADGSVDVSDLLLLLGQWD